MTCSVRQETRRGEQAGVARSKGPATFTGTRKTQARRGRLHALPRFHTRSGLSQRQRPKLTYAASACCPLLNDAGSTCRFFGNPLRSNKFLLQQRPKNSPRFDFQSFVPASCRPSGGASCCYNIRPAVQNTATIHSRQICSPRNDSVNLRIGWDAGTQ